jgi:hypothetical protein
MHFFDLLAKAGSDIAGVVEPNRDDSTPPTMAMIRG